jgi:hypothetical protein
MSRIPTILIILIVAKVLSFKGIKEVTADTRNEGKSVTSSLFIHELRMIAIQALLVVSHLFVHITGYTFSYEDNNA